MDLAVMRSVAARAGRCLHIPPEGEEEGSPEERDADAYPNVGLPGGVGCRFATHGPAILRGRRRRAQAGS
jgi:hypothetical protein